MNPVGGSLDFFALMESRGSFFFGNVEEVACLIDFIEWGVLLKTDDYGTMLAVTVNARFVEYLDAMLMVKRKKVVRRADGETYWPVSIPHSLPPPYRRGWR